MDMSWLKNVGSWAKNNPQLASTIVGTGANMAGGVLAGRGQQQAAEIQQQADNAGTAAKMMGSGPLDIQKQRIQMELMRNLLSGKLQGPMISAPDHLKAYQGTVGQMPVLPEESMKFLSPEAMAAAEQPYWNMVNKLAPGTMTPEMLAKAGYGGAAAASGAQGQALSNAIGGGADPVSKFNANYGAIQAAKQQTGDWEKAYEQVTGEPWPKDTHIKIGANGAELKKDHTTLKKIGKAAATIAPIAAAPFTGGGSLAAIGALSGAARSALDGGGMKGALMGAGMGALGGALNGAGSTPFSMGALGKQMMSPQGLAAMTGAAAPGQVGQIAGMAAPFLPGAKFGPGPQSAPELPPGGSAANGYNNQTSMFPASSGGDTALPAYRSDFGGMLSGALPGVGQDPGIPAFKGPAAAVKKALMKNIPKGGPPVAPWQPPSSGGPNFQDNGFVSGVSQSANAQPPVPPQGQVPVGLGRNALYPGFGQGAFMPGWLQMLMNNSAGPQPSVWQRGSR